MSRIAATTLAHSQMRRPSFGQAMFAYQHVGWDTEPPVKGANHSEAERPLTIENFRDATLIGEIFSEILLPETFLCHAELDRFHRIRIVDWEMNLFVALHK